VDTGIEASSDSFGTRTHLKNNYMRRMSAAVLGIYGNSKEEARSIRPTSSTRTSRSSTAVGATG
jgi:hypothetical protein